MHEISVILNGYKRSKCFNEQLRSIENQTITPKEIMLWQNYAEEFSVPSHVKHAINNYNYGVWARFSFALNAKSEYICVFDDDTIPGDMWFENCLNSINKCNGLLGTIGLIFGSNKDYFNHIRVGWHAPNDIIKQVDIVGHSWFFKREWLSYFWRELPRPNDVMVGEDMHFSAMLQKYANINTYVPPHPEGNRRLWGSIPEKALKYGTESIAISKNQDNLIKMNEYFNYEISKGFSLLNFKS